MLVLVDGYGEFIKKVLLRSSAVGGINNSTDGIQPEIHSFERVHALSRAIKEHADS